MKKHKVLIVPSDTVGCGQMRCIQPYRQLSLQHNTNSQSPFVFDYILPNKNGIPLNLIDNYDAILFQRILDENGLKLVDYAKKKGKIIIQEMDDNILTISSNNPFFHQTKGMPYRRCFRQSVLMSDYMHVTVPEIADIYSKEIGLKHDKFYVFPNAVDITHPKLQQNVTRRNELPSDKIIFGFQGGSSHKDDLEVMPPIFPILDEVPNAIFAFCSDFQTFEYKWKTVPLKYRNRVIFIQPVTDNFDNFPNLPSMYDLGLVPLQNTDFNQCKSHLKILEFGWWNIPSVCSSIPDYERFSLLSNHANPIIKKNKVKIWHEIVIDLLENKALREELGNRTKETILKHFTLNKVNEKRIEFYERIFNVKFTKN